MEYGFTFILKYLLYDLTISAEAVKLHYFLRHHPMTRQKNYQTTRGYKFFPAHGKYCRYYLDSCYYKRFH